MLSARHFALFEARVCHLNATSGLNFLGITSLLRSTSNQEQLLLLLWCRFMWGQIGRPFVRTTHAWLFKWGRQVESVVNSQSIRALMTLHRTVYEYNLPRLQIRLRCKCPNICQTSLPNCAQTLQVSQRLMNISLSISPPVNVRFIPGCL